MNEFLKTREQVENATKYLQIGDLIESGISCKNWELANVLSCLKYGDILDMGSSGSEVLENLVKLKFDGRKAGIDLAYTEDSVLESGIELYKGDLMHTPFEDNSFDTIVSLSTIEHEVDLTLFAKEVSRLLRNGGRLYVSFDYWPQRIDTNGLTLYGLKWNILNQPDVLYLIEVCEFSGLFVSSPVNWETKDAVINPAYCSPFAGISYTFGIFEFIKQ